MPPLPDLTPLGLIRIFIKPRIFITVFNSDLSLDHTEINAL